MYKEVLVSSSIPVAKLKRAFNGGTLSLTKAELSGSDAKIHVHPSTYEKIVKAKRAGRGTRFSITHHEIGYPMKRQIGASVWGKIWNGIKTAFKWAKDSGVLSKIADAAVVPLATYTGQPGAVSAARAGLKSLTGIGVEQEGEGFKEFLQGAKKVGKKAFNYAKKSGALSDLVDLAEAKASKKFPTIEKDIHELRKVVRSKYGIGVNGKPKLVKGSQAAKDHMAALRAMRKKKAGGSFKL